VSRSSGSIGFSPLNADSDAGPLVWPKLLEMKKIYVKSPSFFIFSFWEKI
jgi:hypothetical protein